MTLEKLIEAVEAAANDKPVKVPFQLHSGIRHAAVGLGGLEDLVQFLKDVLAAEDPE